MGWLWTPHSVTWQPRKDVRRGGAINDGTANVDPDVIEPTAFDVFIEAKTAAWAEEKGVMTENQPHLVVGYPSDMSAIVKGDRLTWDDRTLVVENRPIVYDFGDGFPSAELIATDQTTGGRR